MTTGQVIAVLLTGENTWHQNITNFKTGDNLGVGFPSPGVGFSFEEGTYEIRGPLTSLVAVKMTTGKTSQGPRSSST